VGQPQPLAIATTRTSESVASSELADPNSRARGGQPSPTLPLAMREAEQAAVSFARERERVLRRSEHTASVRRFEKVVSIGLALWGGTIVADWWVIERISSARAGHILAIRLAGTLAILLVFWRLRRPPEPSPRLLALMDVGMFTFICTLGGLLVWSSGGIASPFLTGLLVIIVARGATTLAPWRQGVWMFGIPALTFPSVLLFAGQVDERIAAQFGDPLEVTRFVMFLLFLAMTQVLLIMGGDFAWQLRRQALETRNIGRYKLERLLGRGGMGDVWAAYDVTLKHRVALKTVSSQRQSPSALVRFEREARALAELTHPNTVRVFDYGVTDDGLWYYAMELLDGENLHELVVRSGPLPAPRLVNIGRQVLRALGEAHAKGIIHRDIKPENVFVAVLGGEPDIVKLLDFGIAKAPLDTDSKLTATGVVTGTPAYMPPELLLGHAADARSDIYCFGGTLFFAATGKLPFTEQPQLGLLAARLSAGAPCLSDASPGPVSPVLDAIVRRCMASEPSARYASVHEVLEALSELG
jgi:tRNA A-37 threonylcarbamoyl transferase component Bud32